MSFARLPQRGALHDGGLSDRARHVIDAVAIALISLGLISTVLAMSHHLPLTPDIERAAHADRPGLSY